MTGLGPEPFIDPFNKYIAGQPQGATSLVGEEDKYTKCPERVRHPQL